MPNKGTTERRWRNGMKKKDRRPSMATAVATNSKIFSPLKRRSVYFVAYNPDVICYNIALAVTEIRYNIIS